MTSTCKRSGSFRGEEFAGGISVGEPGNTPEMGRKHEGKGSEDRQVTIDSLMIAHFAVAPGQLQSRYSHRRKWIL
jgi:hypothetical protein